MKEGKLLLLYSAVLLSGCGDENSGSGVDHQGRMQTKQGTAQLEAPHSSVQLPIQGGFGRLAPNILAIKETRGKILVVAKANLVEAIRQANELLASSRRGENDYNLLRNSLGSALHEACFPSRRAFTDAEVVKLAGLLQSELSEELKGILLEKCSSACEGVVPPTLAVLNCALANGFSTPEVIATIYADIARTDPVKASVHVLSQPWKPELGLPTARVFAEFVIADPEAGSIAVKAINPESEAFQWAMAGLVQGVRAVDPDSALVWLQSITNPSAAAHANAVSYSPRPIP